MSDPEESDDDATYFVQPDDVESQVFDWGTLKWQSTPSVTGGERFSAGVVRLEPGKGHERHNHPDSDEILYVIRGEGEQEVADQTREVTAGDMIFIPEGIEHGTINTGWETLVLLAVYAPPGPEEVLREMPECQIVPPGELPTEENVRPKDVDPSTNGGEPAGDGRESVDRGEPAGDGASTDEGEPTGAGDGGSA